MPPSLLFINIIIFMATTTSALPAIIPNPQPLKLPTTTTTTTTSTIPAFPEQSDVASTTCHLSLPVDLLPFITTSCSNAALALPTRSQCCPAIKAWIYTAHSNAILNAGTISGEGAELPALPDDSESCIAAADRALREKSHGVALPRVNATCDAAYCYCGVRLTRLSCNGAFEVDAETKRWVPAGDGGKKLARECARMGNGGCGRCLRELNRLKAKEKKQHNNMTASNRECQLLGVTWLLSKNHTLYLPAATSILRTFMVADSTGALDPTSCSRLVDDLPLAVGSSQLDSNDGTSKNRLFAAFWFKFILFSLIPYAHLLVVHLY